MDTAILSSYGIDYDKGLKNCMGNLAFYKRILTMFLKDDSVQRAREAYAALDYPRLFSCMHELKGVSGNAALTELYDSTVPLVEILRHKESGEPDAEVGRLFAVTEQAFARACDGINLILTQA